MDPVDTPNLTAAVETDEVIAPGHTYRSVSDRISDMVLEWPIGIRWAGGLLIALGLLFMFHIALVWILAIGVGVWGINIPVG